MPAGLDDRGRAEPEGARQLRHLLERDRSPTDGLRIDCDYNTDLFDAATIDRWLECYEALLEAIVADTTERVTRVAYIPLRERAEARNEFNATARRLSARSMRPRPDRDAGGTPAGGHRGNVRRALR